MFRAVFGLAGLVSVLVFLPAVGAQTAPDVRLTFSDVPPSRVNTNDTVYVEKFTLTLTAQGIACYQNTVFAVTVKPTSGGAASNASSNATVTFELTPTKPSFSVPAGQYVANAYSGSLEATLLIRPSSIPYGGSDVPVTLAGSLDPPAGCQANGMIRSEAAPKAFTVHFGRGTEPAPVSKSPEMPGPGLLLVAGAVLAAFLVRRGRPGA